MFCTTTHNARGENSSTVLEKQTSTSLQILLPHLRHLRKLNTLHLRLGGKLTHTGLKSIAELPLTTMGFTWLEHTPGGMVFHELSYHVAYLFVCVARTDLESSDQMNEILAQFRSLKRLTLQATVTVGEDGKTIAFQLRLWWIA